MIYSYTYIDHPIQKFHKGITTFFDKMIELDLDTYDEKLHIPIWFKDSVNASKTLLLGNLTSFVKEYHTLKDEEKLNLKEVFEANKNVRSLCLGEGTPKKYDAITNELFRDHLRTFFDELWKRLGNKENGINQEVEKVCGKIISHFQSFREHEEHLTKLCPFCGLSGLLPSTSPNREAYDHYLPKAQYPFIAVNFENLVPMCHDCNSLEKTTTDPLHDDSGARRIVYYPFDMIPKDHFEPRILKDTLYSKGTYSSLLKSIEWHFSLLSNGAVDTRLESWNKIFRLEGRFTEILHDYEKSWFADVLGEYNRRDLMINFTNFRTNYIGKIRSDTTTSERSIVRYAYVYFLLHEDGIEEDLELLIAV